jgi:hypothetical protein
MNFAQYDYALIFTSCSYQSMNHLIYGSAKKSLGKFMNKVGNSSIELTP